LGDEIGCSSFDFDDDNGDDGDADTSGNRNGKANRNGNVASLLVNEIRLNAKHDDASTQCKRCTTIIQFEDTFGIYFCLIVCYNHIIIPYTVHSLF